jgi:hypothetical protein
MNKSRLYSVCLCLNDEIIRVQEILLENLNLLENKEDTKEIPIDVIRQPKYLEIYLKKYNFKDALSNYITSSEKVEDLSIKGPIVIN